MKKRRLLNYLKCLIDFKNLTSFEVQSPGSGFTISGSASMIKMKVHRFYDGDPRCRPKFRNTVYCVFHLFGLCGRYSRFYVVTVHTNLVVTALVDHFGTTRATIKSTVWTPM